MAHRTYDDLRLLLDRCPRGRYKHYKGALYTVTGAAIREADGEPLVIYTGEFGVQFARPVSEWAEIVEHGGKQVRRYTPLD